jgi:NNP family nitrate/nitrite transporter-like MFS transporter
LTAINFLSGCWEGCLSGCSCPSILWTRLPEFIRKLILAASVKTRSLTVLALVVAYYFNHYSDDCPLGSFQEVKKAGLMMEQSAVDSFRSGVYNLNSWILFLQFAGSCGVDFTMCNGAAIYFHDSFGVSIAVSGVLAFLYGISAVYARGVGGWFSDACYERYSLRGRLWAQLLCMVVQGLLNIWFARSDQLSMSIISMVLFSILIQMSMGTCFGIVPYLDGPNTGSVAGIVGAGGNVVKYSGL